MPKRPKDLPAPRTRDAPKFNGDNSAHIRELPRWLEDVERLLANHSVTDAEEIKIWFSRYADADTAEEWTALHTYRNGTVEAHKNAILDLYPEIKDRIEGSLRELDKLFRLQH